MSNTVIKVENLSKQYRLGQVGTGTIRDDFNRFFAKIRGKEDPTLKIGQTNTLASASSSGVEKQHSDYVWALKDINFEVQQGEALGIIGKNGAGKSTLLKILSKVTAPTTGDVKIKGRIASLLEVGTGFHADLTGRENIFLNGSILGMTKTEIRHKFDEIVDFSGVENYIDTPVKRYSSGMYVRLAFAVAAHLESEILILDEVLAVGDNEFQKKCLGKMGDVAKGGRTVLFVSHNMDAISTLTNRCIFLSDGKVEFNGDTSEAINHYINLNKAINLEYSSQPLEDKPNIFKVSVITSHGNNIHYQGNELKVKLSLFCPNKLSNANVSFQIVNEKGIPVIWRWLLDSQVSFGTNAGTYEITCSIPKLRLYKGKYSLIVNFAENFGKLNYQRIENICHFEVVMYEKAFEFQWVNGACVYFEEAEWNCSNK